MNNNPQQQLHFAHNYNQQYHSHRPEYTVIPIQTNTTKQPSSHDSTCPVNSSNQCCSESAEGVLAPSTNSVVVNNNTPSVQASFHTLHNNYFNSSSTKARPMVIHTKMVNNNNNNNNNNHSQSTSSPSRTTSNINTNTTQNNNNNNTINSYNQTVYCTNSSSDDSSPSPTNINGLTKEKYKRPCPSESYRNIAASLTLEEISRHYHLTRQDACTALKVSWRDLKERLNVLGVSRWPKTNAKKVTQFNTVTSHFEQLCSVIETGCPPLTCYPPQQRKKFRSTPQPHSNSMVIVDNSNCVGQQQQSSPLATNKPNKKPNKIVKITGNVEKNPACLSPNNGSICSLSSPSTASNISFNVQQNSTLMGSPKNKSQPKGAFQAYNQTVQQNHLANTYSYQAKCEVQYYPAQQPTGSSGLAYSQQKHSASNCCHHVGSQSAHQSLPNISTFFDEKPTTSPVQYHSSSQQILPSISSFDTFLQSHCSNSSLKRGRTESSEDVLLNKKRII
ncbi:predicted protein [Naegleria gruberi]|uniref:Predicted protein n=1 Tax=Naegleria gruberi TaxID=5762 RepID=D2VB63_NAEGR|nr:uncharacterized protein NAEGRDRAFT_48124 [Naegleria gruberi]EFC45853.1 predicted protein [Naegleria gruberi]|eukprot:XP_002678597.1 predicted protein [Naegleria gruberi strain NEG-M]